MDNEEWFEIYIHVWFIPLTYKVICSEIIDMIYLSHKDKACYYNESSQGLKTF